ncbi:MAG TPA: asparagine synthase-related protein [Actinomycetota bacterium]|nr:asparagine synthase-related protein [Actinomycetota bacterium]
MIVPDRYEFAAGTLIGTEPHSRDLPPSNMDPARALEDALIPALARGTLAVAFSGGRDSSIVLAAATRAARREGLPEPIAVTTNYPGDPGADESRWQELIIRFLGLREWQRSTVVGGEHEIIGPVALPVLRKHGVLLPGNAASWVPMLREMQGSTLATGAGGDSLFEARRWGPFGDLRSGRSGLGPHEARNTIHAVSPLPIKKLVARARLRRSFPWLQPAARTIVTQRLAKQHATEPIRWDRRVAWFRRLRNELLNNSTLDLLARGEGVTMRHPLFDEGFLSALATRGGRDGMGTRSQVMVNVFSGWLPEEVLNRSDKGQFGEVFWGPRCRSFVRRWSGAGVDAEMVDPIALANVWAQPQPDARTYQLLQAAWLASDHVEDQGETLGR